MNWRFWQPRHTVESVARHLASGLRDGSIVLDEPLGEESFDDDMSTDAIVLQIDVGDAMSDDAILELVKKCANSADRDNRTHGGGGLRIGKVVFEFPKVKVALRPKNATGPTPTV